MNCKYDIIFTEDNCIPIINGVKENINKGNFRIISRKEKYKNLDKKKYTLTKQDVKDIINEFSENNFKGSELNESENAKSDCAHIFEIETEMYNKKSDNIEKVKLYIKLYFEKNERIVFISFHK